MLRNAGLAARAAARCPGACQLQRCLARPIGGAAVAGGQRDAVSPEQRLVRGQRRTASDPLSLSALHVAVRTLLRRVCDQMLKRIETKDSNANGGGRRR